MSKRIVRLPIRVGNQKLLTNKMKKLERLLNEINDIRLSLEILRPKSGH